MRFLGVPGVLKLFAKLLFSAQWARRCRGCAVAAFGAGLPHHPTEKQKVMYHRKANNGKTHDREER